ncbi:MAG: glycerophosphodiester phosphodiesterase family protein [Oligoflexia bacterium]|nr:glycerophosphodiester phosphodiesterase family protein [Oligoflexia bacterium]
MIISLLILLACTSHDQPGDTSLGTDSGSGTRSGSGSGSDSGSDSGTLGSTWPPDPSTYDCRAKGSPDRIDPVDPTCMVDRTCTTRLVSGHRGMGGTFGALAPEDTVSAVRAAIAYGVDFVETDPRPTADGVLVNLHDTTVDRTTDGTGEASKMSLAEIQALHVDAGDLPGDFSCERVPTFQQILSAARGRVHVLVDANKTDRVDLLVGDIVATDTLEWAIFDTSSVDKIDQALAIEPDLHTMIRVDSEQSLDDELAHFTDHPPVIVEIEDTMPQLAPAVTAAGNRAMKDVFIEDLQVIGADDVSGYGDVYDAGVMILQSERPELVLEYLAR